MIITVIALLGLGFIGGFVVGVAAGIRHAERPQQATTTTRKFEVTEMIEDEARFLAALERATRPRAVRPYVRGRRLRVRGHDDAGEWHP